MLVPFAIDADALVGDPPSNEIDLLDGHEALLMAWKRIGLLVFDGDYSSTSVLQKAIEAVPTGSVLHSRWRDFVLRAPSLKGGDKWRGELDESSLSSLSEIARVCFTNDGRRKQFHGLAKDKNLELRTFTSAASCKAFDSACTDAASHIGVGESAKEVWRSRFSALAEATADGFKKVIIVDRYVIERHLNKKGGEFAHFLKFLSDTAKDKKHVTVYTSQPKKTSPGKTDRKPWPDEEIAKELGQLKRDLENIASLTIRIAPKLTERKVLKDRFVMFGDKYVWDLGHGLEPFEHQDVRSKCSATLKTWESTKTYNESLDDMQGGNTNPIKIWK